MGVPDIVATVKKRGWWIAGAAVLVAVVALGIWGLLRAQQFESLARAGKADAAAGIKVLEARQSDAALASFTKGRDEFAEARALLGPGWLRGVPWLGRQLDAAEDLTTIGVEGSAAGASAAELLNQAGEATGTDRLTQLVQLARPHLDAALVSLVAVAEHSEGLTTDGLVPPLAAAVTEATKELAPLQLILQRSTSLLDLERYLFGSQHRFLVLSQNGAQLRPTGGFPGTYGLVEFGPDGFHLTKFADIYTLPPDRLDLPIPGGGQPNYTEFRLRNSNAWMDFPTSAGVMDTLWQNMKQPAIDGIVAIDIPTIRDLLKVFGPIRVPESDRPLTAKNVLEQLSYVVGVEYSGKGYRDRKNAVVSLAKAVVERITHLSEDEFLPTMKSLATSANEKHLQLWFNDPGAQADIVRMGWAGAIDPPADTTDIVAVSNSVIKRPAKANLGVDKSLDYDVRLSADGSAESTLLLGYQKTSQSPLGDLQKLLPNYVRVHRADGTTRRTEAGTNGIAFLKDETGLPTFGYYFELPRGKSTSVDLRTRVPDALRKGVAADVPGGPATAAPTVGVPWHYRLVLARQSDLVDTKATVTVHVPDGWRVEGAAAWFRASGTPVAVTSSPGSVGVETPLKQDLLLDVTLVKK